MGHSLRGSKTILVDIQLTIYFAMSLEVLLLACSSSHTAASVVLSKIVDIDNNKHIKGGRKWEGREGREGRRGEEEQREERKKRRSEGGRDVGRVEGGKEGERGREGRKWWPKP